MRMGGVRPVLVTELGRFARLRLGHREGIEERLDEYVASIGGTRADGDISLGHLARRLARRRKTHRLRAFRVLKRSSAKVLGHLVKPRPTSRYAIGP